MAVAAGADHELADAVLGIGRPVGVQRGEPLVVVVVPAQHHVRAGGVEGPPERLSSVASSPWLPEENRGWCQ